jgi:hypothetical protein
MSMAAGMLPLSLGSVVNEGLHSPRYEKLLLDGHLRNYLWTLPDCLEISNPIKINSVLTIFQVFFSLTPIGLLNEVESLAGADSVRASLNMSAWDEEARSFFLSLPEYTELVMSKCMQLLADLDESNPTAASSSSAKVSSANAAAEPSVRKSPLYATLSRFFRVLFACMSPALLLKSTSSVMDAV